MLSAKDISIIIPTLNEAAQLAENLAHIKKIAAEAELIIADGGSIDHTTNIARNYAKIISSEKGRGRQMNAGVKVAKGKILWFIHADCQPAEQSVETMLAALADPQIIGGAFCYKHDAPGIIFRVSDYFSNKKNRLFKHCYGDMGIFVRREIFEQLNGYREYPIMEDIDFCLRLKDLGKISILPPVMNTSSRRWQEEGALKNIVRNWLLQILWKMGTPPEQLSRWYKFENIKEQDVV